MNHTQNRAFEKFENDVRQGKEYTKLEWNEFPYPESDGPLYPDVRYFGEFDCEQCGRWWMSGNSWFGFGQNCEGCGQMTYPCKLSKLLGSDVAVGVKEKPHSQTRCERCKVLGYLCRNSEGVKLDSGKNAVQKGWKSKSKSNSVSYARTFYSSMTSSEITGFSYPSTHSSNSTNQIDSFANLAQNPTFVFTNSGHQISNLNYVNQNVSYASMASRATPKFKLPPKPATISQNHLISSRNNVSSTSKPNDESNTNANVVSDNKSSTPPSSSNLEIKAASEQKGYFDFDFLFRSVAQMFRNFLDSMFGR